MGSYRENPFIGLRAFDYAERARFFGRERQSYALYRLTAFGFVAVIGNSGSGKSSLVRAGLLPLLFDAQEQQPWKVAVMTPGGSPLERLAIAIATLAPETEDNDAHAVRRARIAYLIERSSNGIADALDEMPELTETSVLLVVDQFEEIFRIAADSREETAAFVALLLQLHRRRPSAHVLITMRSDFIGDCARFSGLPEAVSDTQYLVPSLSREQRQAAIVKPIARAGATIDPTLVERLINEVGFESDQLPVLQHALARMWLAASDRVALSNSQTLELTEDDYRAIGTLDGALSQHADAIMAELAGREHVVEAVFRALSERDAESRATRRVLTLRQLVAETGLPEADVIAVVDRFRAADCAFLLPAGGGLTPETRIDVVHEALLRRWERLTPSDPDERGWLDREEEYGRYYRSLLARIDSGETTLQLGSVNERYAWWTSVPHTDAWAMRYGGRHDRVDEFFAASLAALEESERARAQAEADEQDRRKQKERATRRFLVVTGSIATIAIVLLAVTFFALLGSQRTTNASLVTQSELVARDAGTAENHGDATNAALLALEVLPQHLADPDRPFTWSAYGALTDALANLRELHDYQPSGPVAKIEYKPDGSRFVAQGREGTIWIWKIGAPTPEHVLNPRSFARDVEFSADGSLIASASDDGSVHVWNAYSGALIRVMRDFHYGIDRAIFSADGLHLLAMSADENVTRLYDVRTGRMIREVRGGSAAFYSKRLGIVRNRVITADATRAVTLWNASLTKALHVFHSGGSPLVDAVLSGDENRIAIAHADSTADVFDALSGRRIAHLVSRDRSIDRITMTGNGSRVVTVNDAYARVWDSSTGAILATIPTEHNTGFLPALSRDGKAMLLPSTDGSIGVYSVDLGARLFSVVGTGESVLDGGFSPDGRRLIIANPFEGMVREWDISRNASQILGTTVPVTDAHNGAAIALAPGRKTFAVADPRNIHIYDASTGATIRTIPFYDLDPGIITAVAMSPDGHTLMASDSQRHVIERWNWRRGTRERTFNYRNAGPSDFHNSLVLSPDGKTFAMISRNFVRIHDVQTGRILLAISANQYELDSVQFSPDGRRLLTGSRDGWLRVYDARSGARILAIPAHAFWVTDAEFSPDGGLIASASLDRRVRIWDANDGAPVAALHTSSVAGSVAFSSRGTSVLIAGGDGVHLWDFATNRFIFALRGFADGMTKAAFALHDTRIVTIGSDTTIRLWHTPTLPSCQQAIDEAHARMAHELTPDLRSAEFISARHAPSILNAFLPHQTCS